MPVNHQANKEVIILQGLTLIYIKVLGFCFIMGIWRNMVKNLPANAGNVGSVPRLGRSPREGNGNLLQYSCLGNPMDKNAWRAIVLGVAKESDTT